MSKVSVRWLGAFPIVSILDNFVSRSKQLAIEDGLYLVYTEHFLLLNDQGHAEVIDSVHCN